MRNTHHLFRAISLTVGLVLLLVTGTAAMMASFSGPTPGNRVYASYVQAVPLPPLQSAAQALSPTGDDHLLYQRVARADGSHAWELTPAPQIVLAQEGSRSANVAIRPALPDPGFSRVSYSLQLRPGGLNRAVKPCNSAMPGPAVKSKTLASYDLSCTTLG